MSERQKVEIDYCPQCRGVWLDRGELDKIIERIESEGVARSPQHGQHNEAHPQAYRETYHPPHQEYYGDEYKHGQHGYKKKHRESWFGELFD
jgi:Zn-finger nucleic acid-binding protein